MIFTCDQCGKKFKLNPDKMKENVARFKCSGCGYLITAKKPAGTAGTINGTGQSPDKPVASDDKMKENTSKKFKLPLGGLSIRSKITIIISALMVIALVVFGLITILTSRNVLMDRAEANLGMTAKLKADEYSLILGEVIADAEAIARYAGKLYDEQSLGVEPGFDDFILMPLTGTGGGNPEMEKKLLAEKAIIQRVVEMMQNVVTNHYSVVRGYVGTETNMVGLSDIEAVDVLAKEKNYNSTQQHWYKAAVKIRLSTVSPPYIDPITQERIVTCSTPIYIQSRGMVLAGVIGFDIPLENIHRDIPVHDIGYNSYSMLIHTNGDILVNPNMDHEDTLWREINTASNIKNTSNVEFNAIIERMLNGDYGIGNYESEGESTYIAYEPVPGVDYRIGILASVKEVIRPANTLRNFLIGLLVVFVIISIVVGVYIGNNITSPIMKLIAQADMISKGAHNLKVLEENRKDEIGELTKSFNRMAISLKLALARFERQREKN